MPLPHLAMDAVPFTPLTAAFLDNMIANIEYTNSLVEGVPASGTGGWVFLTAGANISSVAANGNRSYNLTCSGIDLTSTVSNGMRLRTTRTVAAPTQSTSLNGTTQYYSKTSPAGMTFTDDFVAGAWVKLSAYSSSNDQVIISRYNGTSGWRLIIAPTGQIYMQGYNGSSSNSSYINTYQSIPLNKWVHIAAQLDMSAFTATPTTSYVMIDGVDVPSAVARTGTFPTALVQAGNLEIGSQNSGTMPFNGKIAQAFVYSAKVTQATIKASMNQTLAGTETSLISAYSFSGGVITDLNTTNANNLTANGSAVATNADSPFGGQAGGTISSTLDYGIIQKATFSTDTTLTVQVPEGCTIPTSGGLASVAYSYDGKPFGMPIQRGKWTIANYNRVQVVQSSAVLATWYNIGNLQLSVPVGEWILGYKSTTGFDRSVAGRTDYAVTLSTGAASESDTRYTTGNASGNAGIFSAGLTAASADVSLSAATVYYHNLAATSGVSSSNLYLFGPTGTPVGTGIIYAENAYL